MWKIDTTQTGIPSIFRDYEWLAIEHIYEMKKKITSKTTWDYVNPRKKISRASIIIFLEKLVKANILGFDEVSGKGGFHREHYILVEREDLPRTIALDTLRTLKSVFPDDLFTMDILAYAKDTKIEEIHLK